MKIDKLLKINLEKIKQKINTESDIVIVVDGEQRKGMSCTAMRIGEYKYGTSL